MRKLDDGTEIFVGKGYMGKQLLTHVYFVSVTDKLVFPLIE